MAEHELTLQAVRNTIKQMAGQANTLSVPRVFVSLTGDHVSAILLSQIIYWSERTKDPDGWFYKTTTEWFDEIGVTYSQLGTAIEKLRPLGLEVSVRKVYEQNASGGTPKAHYRLNEETFYSALLEVLENKPVRKSENPKLDKSEIRQIRKSENLNPTFDKSQSDFQKTRKSYKEAETTTEITTEITQGADAPQRVICSGCKKTVNVLKSNGKPVAACLTCKRDALEGEPVAGDEPDLDGDAAKCVAYYKHVFEEEFKRPPQVTKGKDFGIVREIVKEHGKKATQEFIRKFIKLTDEKLKEAGYPLAWLPLRINAIIVSGAVRSVARASPDNFNPEALNAFHEKKRQREAEAKR